MSTEILFIVEESREGGVLARADGQSIFVQADTSAEIADLVRDAVNCHFDGPDMPKLIRLHFARDEVLAV